jgi:hypothetical protein
MVHQQIGKELSNDNDNFEKMNEIGIDISRAKGNSEIVRRCAEQLGMRVISESEPEQTGDDFRKLILWHNIVYPDMRNIVRGRKNVYINKFPGYQFHNNVIVFAKTYTLLVRNN